MFLINFLFVIVGAPSFAAEDLPFGVLVNDKDMASLSVTCFSGDKKGEINCDFNQLLLSKKPDQKAETEKEISSLSERKRQELISQFTKSCKTSKLKSPVPQTDAKESNIDMQASQEYEFAKACKCLEEKKGSFDCASEFILWNAESESKKCRISHNSFKFTMKKISEGVWMNNPAPAGLCNTVTAVTIKKLEGKYTRWQYIQTRLSSDSGPLCGLLDLNKPYIFESGSNLFNVNCQGIDLGP